jgi:hypothetical protein
MAVFAEAWDGDRDAKNSGIVAKAPVLEASAVGPEPRNLPFPIHASSPTNSFLYYRVPLRGSKRANKRNPRQVWGLARVLLQCVRLR